MKNVLLACALALGCAAPAPAASLWDEEKPLPPRRMTPQEKDFRQLTIETLRETAAGRPQAEFLAGHNQLKISVRKLTLADLPDLITEKRLPSQKTGALYYDGAAEIVYIQEPVLIEMGFKPRAMSHDDVRRAVRELAPLLNHELYHVQSFMQAPHQEGEVEAAVAELRYLLEREEPEHDYIKSVSPGLRVRYTLLLMSWRNSRSAQHFLDVVKSTALPSLYDEASMAAARRTIEADIARLEALRKDHSVYKTLPQELLDRPNKRWIVEASIPMPEAERAMHRALMDEIVKRQVIVDFWNSPQRVALERERWERRVRHIREDWRRDRRRRALVMADSAADSALLIEGDDRDEIELIKSIKDVAKEYAAQAEFDLRSELKRIDKLVREGKARKKKA